MTENKYEGYFGYYISKAGTENITEGLELQRDHFLSFLEGLDFSVLAYAYAEEKWTVKEVIFHIIETEIIMLYRAIRISKGDLTPLPGYDENLFMERSRSKSMEFSELTHLFKNTRNNTLFYFQHFNESELSSRGKFSDLELDVKGIGYLLLGHLNHHLEVLHDRYLSN